MTDLHQTRSQAPRRWQLHAGFSSLAGAPGTSQIQKRLWLHREPRAGWGAGGTRVGLNQGRSFLPTHLTSQAWEPVINEGGDDGPSVPPHRGGAIGALIRHSSAVSPQMLAVAAGAPWEGGVEHTPADRMERAGLSDSSAPRASGLRRLRHPTREGARRADAAVRRAGSTCSLRDLGHAPDLRAYSATPR